MSILQKINNVNNTIALKTTAMISTMWCVYAFAILVAIPLFLPLISPIIQYVSSAFLQLTFLPLILVGQSLLSQKSEDRAEQDHLMIMSEFAEVKEMHAELTTILADMTIIKKNID